MSENSENKQEEMVENNPPQVEDSTSTIDADKQEQTVENKDEKSESTKDWKASYDELNDKYLRLYSEFDNYRKRTLKEKADWNKMAGEDVFKAILPVLDDFERALKSMETAQDIQSVKEGILLIHNKMKNNLTSKGLEAIDSVGQTFDSDLHEALTNIPAPTEDLKGKVVDEIERCYKLNGKVIRFARVVVGQ
ncbi:MAG: nucleotide exchange factor GrpE [Bacteroidia bacterium]|nr:nucleotide exchange factor GrpE [Bacteroidia bacterium]